MGTRGAGFLADAPWRITAWTGAFGDGSGSSNTPNETLGSGVVNLVVESWMLRGGSIVGRG